MSATLGYVLSLLLDSLPTHDCVANFITTLGLISIRDETVTSVININTYIALIKYFNVLISIFFGCYYL